MDNPLSYEDLNDWWDDLTIEQRRAAFVAWQKTDIKSIYAQEPSEPPHKHLMTDAEFREWLRKNTGGDPSKRFA